jgi:hypothetical protein
LQDVTESLRSAVDAGDLGAISNGVAALERLTQDLQTHAENKSMSESFSFDCLGDDQFERFERAHDKLCKAVFTFLDALSQYEETTDVDELYRLIRQLNPDITISKSIIRAWAVPESGDDDPISRP